MEGSKNNSGETGNSDAGPCEPESKTIVMPNGVRHGRRLKLNGGFATPMIEVNAGYAYTIYVYEDDELEIIATNLYDATESYRGCTKQLTQKQVLQALGDPAENNMQLIQKIRGGTVEYQFNLFDGLARVPAALMSPSASVAVFAEHYRRKMISHENSGRIAGPMTMSTENLSSLLSLLAKNP